MFKTGDKFIIEIERKDSAFGNGAVYLVKGIENLYMRDDFLSQLERYIEPKKPILNATLKSETKLSQKTEKHLSLPTLADTVEYRMKCLESTVTESQTTIALTALRKREDELTVSPLSSKLCPV